MPIVVAYKPRFQLVDRMALAAKDHLHSTEERPRVEKLMHENSEDFTGSYRHVDTMPTNMEAT